MSTTRRIVISLLVATCGYLLVTLGYAWENAGRWDYYISGCGVSPGYCFPRLLNPGTPAAIAALVLGVLAMYVTGERPHLIHIPLAFAVVIIILRLNGDFYGGFIETIIAKGFLLFLLFLLLLLFFFSPSVRGSKQKYQSE